MSEHYRRSELAGGLQVLSEWMPGLRSASLGVWVRAGSLSESPADMGICHLLEHMVFKGTRRRGAREIAIVLERVGWNSPEMIMKRALQIADRKIIDLQERVQLDKPKVIFADAVAASHTSILVGDLAKLLYQNGIKTGGNRLFGWMRENGYLIKRKGTDYNMPTQRSAEMKLFEVKETTINNPDGSIKISKTPKVTGKGQQYFINLFMKNKEMEG